MKFNATVICRVIASGLLAAGFLFAPVLFGIGPKAGIAPTSSAVEIGFVGGIGSGVYIGNDEVVTARHVVQKASRSWMVVIDQAGEQVYAKPLWTSPTTDVAVVKLQGHLNLISPASLDKRAPVVGENIEVVGCPFGRQFVHTFGTVTGPPTDGMAPLGWRDAIPINAEVHPGNSGGPAYDRDGKVLGIVVGALFDNNHQPIINIMISSREVML